jgi:hypothetical protein
LVFRIRRLSASINESLGRANLGEHHPRQEEPPAYPRRHPDSARESNDADFGEIGLRSPISLKSGSRDFHLQRLQALVFRLCRLSASIHESLERANLGKHHAHQEDATGVSS